MKRLPLNGFFLFAISTLACEHSNKIIELTSTEQVLIKDAADRNSGTGYANIGLSSDGFTITLYNGTSYDLTEVVFEISGFYYSRRRRNSSGQPDFTRLLRIEESHKSLTNATYSAKSLSSSPHSYNWRIHSARGRPGLSHIEAK